MKKALRISWLIFATIVLFPVIIAVELVWFVYCICAAKLLNEPITLGVQTWYQYLKTGIAMNADFVKNGL